VTAWLDTTTSDRRVKVFTRSDQAFPIGRDAASGRPAGEISCGLQERVRPSPGGGATRHERNFQKAELSDEEERISPKFARREILLFRDCTNFINLKQCVMENHSIQMIGFPQIFKSMSL
jgi:hypothetical protein